MTGGEDDEKRALAAFGRQMDVLSLRAEIDELIDGRLTWPEFVTRRRLDEEEADLFRQHVRRAGVRAVEHIADARAARRG